MRIAPHATRAARAAAAAIPLALLAAACTAAPSASRSGTPSARPAAPPAQPSLTGVHPCPGLPGFTCSYLAVPLDRSGQVPGTLRLQVATAANVHAPRGTLLFLTGGPGQPGVRFVAPVAHELPAAVRAYRLVMIDQRGTGGAALNCPDLQRQMGESDTLPPTAQAVRSCAETLGVRRNFFTTADTVADLEALRRALHVRSWTLDGVSYGTFAAERYALAHPGRVRRLVLDSVVPRQDANPLYLASMHRAAFVLRQACLRQHCGYDPAAELAQVVARYGHAARIFDIMVILSIIDPRLSSPGIGFLARLHQAANGSPGPLKDLISGFYSGSPVRPQEYSSGLHAATLCADIPDMPWGNSAAPLGGRQAALAQAIRRIPDAASWPFPPATAGEQGIMQECRYWPPARPDPAPPDRELTMPVLLLAGELDLSTPLPWARQEAAQLPRARLVVVGGAGHSTQLHSAPAAAAAERFLLAPSRRLRGELAGELGGAERGPAADPGDRVRNGNGLTAGCDVGQRMREEGRVVTRESTPGHHLHELAGGDRRVGDRLLKRGSQRAGDIVVVDRFGPGERQDSLRAGFGHAGRRDGGHVAGIDERDPRVSGGKAQFPCPGQPGE